MIDITCEVSFCLLYYGGVQRQSLGSFSYLGVYQGVHGS